MTRLEKELVSLQERKDRIQDLKTKERTLFEKVMSLTYGSEKDEVSKERMEIVRLTMTEEAQIPNQENIIQALENEGEITDVADKLGGIAKDIPDFRKIDTNNISFDEDNILTEPKPIYIPSVNEDTLASKGYVFDAIRIEKDTYILAIHSYRDEDKESIHYNHFVLLTLDQLVLTFDYFFKKAKAKNEERAEKRSLANEKYWDSLPEERRIKFLSQSELYNSLPAKIRKTITRENYEALSWQEKEKIHKFYKREGAKRITSKLEDKQMWTSFHYMYQRFLNPDAWPINKEGILQVGKKPMSIVGLYGNPEIFKYWYWFRDMMDFKIKDIKIQQTELEESYKQALETSFGESNTSNVLKDKYGILVKRQNGDPINAAETDQIETAWSLVQSTFGNLKPNAEKYNIKVSHSGQKLIFASKAVGVFVQDMGTIGVSDKYGDNQFRSTMSHEIAHFIDHFIGELNGKRWATDDYESTAGTIAIQFRNNMNKPKGSQSDYVNASKECFARAFQQYFGTENYGDDASIAHSYVDLGRVQPIYTADDFVPKEKFETIIRPLIIQFLSENADVFKYTVDVDRSNEIVPVGTEQDLEIPKENRIFTKPTKKQIEDVISGKGNNSKKDSIGTTSGFLRTIKGTGGQDSKEKSFKQEETKRLKQFAKTNGLFLSKDELPSKKYISEGAEQKVYSINSDSVIKLNDTIFYSTWLDYLNSLSLHNYFFPDTAYELLGFTEIDNTLFAVVKQPIILEDKETDLSRVEKLMNENGFLKKKNNDYYNPELGLILEDLHEGNVLTRKGILYFVDTVFYQDKQIKETEIYESEEILGVISTLESLIPESEELEQEEIRGVIETLKSLLEN